MHLTPSDTEDNRGPKTKGQQGTKDKGTQHSRRTVTDNGGPKTEGQQGTKDRLKLNPSQCQAVHEVQGAAGSALMGSPGSRDLLLLHHLLQLQDVYKIT